MMIRELTQGQMTTFSSCVIMKTPTITPAPVFHKEGNVTGFIRRDCAVHGDPKKVDVHMKICLKSAKVVAWLKKIANGEDWKKGLELKSKELERLKLQKKELERF
ncbi:uncharacterized protein [Miscanthus floridulus]|uniref:uncharacterized protein isoform X3 n=1 Tax=Miscanthus floridulus TaxID=154761 RepID=UPI00345B0DC7